MPQVEPTPYETFSKVADGVRVAYQVPERDGGECARSFEDAFIVANAEHLAKNSGGMALGKIFTDDTGRPLDATEIESQAWELSGKLAKEKTDFAFDIMLMENWSVPRYIAEGLRWLSS